MENVHFKIRGHRWAIKELREGRDILYQDRIWVRESLPHFEKNLADFLEVRRAEFAALMLAHLPSDMRSMDFAGMAETALAMADALCEELDREYQK